MKYKTIFILFILSLSFFKNVAAEDILSLAKETLKLNESAHNYFSKKEVLEKFSDIKDYIQTDLKNGNKNARIDIFLLLDGLIQNNLASLQSFLATSNHETFSQEFSPSITYEYAEKLAYALKENKYLLTTEYIVDNSLHKGKCINYVNGYKISNNHSFFAPTGLPYYIASYCNDNTFSANKIQSETIQPKFEINLNEYGSPDVSIKSSDEKPKLINENRKKVSSDKQNKENNFLISTGLAYIYFSSAIKNENISNIGMNYGSIFYSTTSVQYQNLFAAIDIAPINKDVISYKEVSIINGQGSKNTSTTKFVQSQKGLFLRPSLGINKILYKFNQNISASFSSDVNMTFISMQGNNSYSNSSPGLDMSPHLNINFEHNFTFNFGVFVGGNFPSSEAELVLGVVSTFGYFF